MQDWDQHSHRDRTPAHSAAPARRPVLAGLAGAGLTLLAAPALLRLVPARAAEETDAAGWRGRVADLTGRYEGDGFRQEIAVARGGFAIRQHAPPDLVSQKQWPSMVYRRVGRANYFAGAPADRIITEHEVWWARFDPRWLTVEARFFDRRGARMHLVTGRRPADGGDALIWRVRMFREEAVVLDETLRLARA